MRPETIHADTQGESTSIFDLAYLLGIPMMAANSSLERAQSVSPPGQHRYHHIDSLFNTQAEWYLIETMLPDMLRVPLSLRPRLSAKRKALGLLLDATLPAFARSEICSFRTKLRNSCG